MPSPPPSASRVQASTPPASTNCGTIFSIAKSNPSSGTGSSLDAQQRALQYSQASLGQQLDLQGTTTSDSGTQHSLAEDISSLFNGFQSLSSQPSSLAERQILVAKAQDLTTQFSQIARRLDDVDNALDQSVASDVELANAALTDIAHLNASIVAAELGGAGRANDLRDTREQRIEDLAKIANITVTNNPSSSGALDVSIDGVPLVDGPQLFDLLESYSDPAGLVSIRSLATATPITLSGGSLHGTITARDGAVASLRTDLDTLASELVSRVNAIHTPGFDLQDRTGLAFFTGSDAATISVNSDLLADPSRIQAAATPNAHGDNQVILALAQLGDQSISGLQNQTFSEKYQQSVASLGQALNRVNTQSENQGLVEQMLASQRDSASGVSLDEEMTDLIRFQRAFEASARLITTVSEMLETVVNLKR